jgi:hypothetical protein
LCPKGWSTCRPQEYVVYALYCRNHKDVNCPSEDLYSRGCEMKKNKGFSCKNSLKMHIYLLLYLSCCFMSDQNEDVLKYVDA